MDYTNAVITSFVTHFNVASVDPIHFLPPHDFLDIAFETEDTNSDDLATEEDD